MLAAMTKVIKDKLQRVLNTAAHILRAPTSSVLV